MRRFCIIVIAWCAAAALPASGETRIITMEGGGISIESLPAAAKVYLDGIERGLTPLFLEAIPTGVHTLRLSKDRYEDWSAQIAVSVRERMEAHIELVPLTGKIIVNIIGGQEPPVAAHVFLDGVEVKGREFDAEAGWRTVKVSAFGWEDEQKTIFIGSDKSVTINFELKRAAFTLDGLRVSRAVFNPYAMGARAFVSIDFSVNATGSGRFKVLDSADNEVFLSIFDEFRQANQHYSWDGRDSGGEILPDGVYTVKIEAKGGENGESLSLSAPVEIDASLEDTPAALGSALAGMVLVPFAASQPKGSFQIEAGIIIGNLPDVSVPANALLFSAAFCFTPLDTWQFAAAINIRPDENGASVSAAAGSVKKELCAPAGLVPGIAAAVGYGLATGGGVSGDAGYSGLESAGGIKSGLQAAVPFSWRAGRHASLYLAPSALWASEDGALREPLPWIVLSWGAMLHFGPLSAGASAQYPIATREGIEGLYPAMAAEFRFNPPRSNLSVGLQSGVFFADAGNGAGVYVSGGMFIGMFF